MVIPERLSLLRGGSIDEYKLKWRCESRQMSIRRRWKSTKEVLTHETARNSAVQKAEGVIDAVNTSFGWAFVDKRTLLDTAPG